jgi:hypothetical protein
MFFSFKSKIIRIAILNDNLTIKKLKYRKKSFSAKMYALNRGSNRNIKLTPFSPPSKSEFRILNGEKVNTVKK